MYPETSGIYKITNIQNNACYIGQATNLKRRIQEHFIDAFSETNNCYNTKFYSSIRKYGKNNFISEIIELCDASQLDEKEIYWIDYYDSYHHGYNSTLGGQFWSENIHSEEVENKRAITRAKNKSLMSENHPRAKLTNEQVIEIRKRYANGEEAKSILEDFQNYNYSLKTFKNIIFGISYKSVEYKVPKDLIRKSGAQFTKEQIIKIREAYYLANKSTKELSNEYHASQALIRKIVNRTAYSHIKDEIPNNRTKQHYHVSESDKNFIKEKNAEGWSNSKIAKELHFNTTTICKWVKKLN